MGNNVCCDQTRTNTPFQKSNPQIIKRSITVEPPKKVQQKPEPEYEYIPPHVSEPKHEPKQQSTHQPKVQETPVLKEEIEIPEPSARVTEVLEENRFFSQVKQQQKHTHIKRYGADVYVGQLDEDQLRPNGFGRMYKPDRSLYVGYFKNGRAQGKGAYIFNDGSYYDGDFHNNCAESENGHFVSQSIQYKGGFKNNTFEGLGTERGEGYVFEGEYKRGARTKGLLKWGNNEHVYEGTFNESNQFHGRGVLSEPEGKYEGEFVNGEKQGQGVYNFKKNSSRYVGSYVKGQREGSGTIYHGNGEIAYRGGMKNGLPHGEGQIFKDGKFVKANWNEGLDASLVPPQ